jgi:hypothetical protein
VWPERVGELELNEQKEQAHGATIWHSAGSNDPCLPGGIKIRLRGNAVPVTLPQDPVMPPLARRGS